MEKKRSHHKKVPKRSHHKKIVKLVAPVREPILFIPENFPEIEEPIIIVPSHLREERIAEMLREPNWFVKAWKWVVG